MKKKINYGVVTFLAVFAMVIAFLVGFGIFRVVENAKIERYLTDELKTQYNLSFDELTADVTYITPEKADVQVYLFSRANNGISVFVGEYKLQTTKTNGNWKLTYSASEIKPIEREVDPEWKMF